MGRTRGTRAGLAALLPALLAAVALAACGSDDGSGGGTTNGATSAGGDATSALARLVPDDVRQRGVLRVVMFDGNLPWHAFDDAGNGIGADAELDAAVAEKLGLRAEFTNVEAAGMVPGLQAGRFDMLANVADVPERRAAMRFVHKSREYNGVLVKQGNPLGIETLADLCGRRVALLGAATVLIGALEAVPCPAGTRMEMVPFATQGEAYLAVLTGRAEAAGVGFSATRWALAHAPASSPLGKLEMVATVEPFERTFNSFGIDRPNEQLQRALQAAFDEVVSEGTYRAILARWDASDLALGDDTPPTP